MQKPKSSAKDVLAEAGKHTNYAELALFDKVHTYTHTHIRYNIHPPTRLPSPFLPRSARHCVTRKCMRTSYVVWFSSMRRSSHGRSWYTL